MAIKYHDNMHGEQYGTDHKLTNNWNPSENFKDDEYISVHFRINNKYYDCMHGSWYDQDDRTAFNQEVRNVLASLEWNIGDGIMDVPEKGNAALWIHPQDISGNVKKSEVKEIAEAFEHNNTFSLRWVDLYEDIYEITDAEYAEYLEAKEDVVIDYLLHNLGTSRRNKYYRISNVYRKLVDMVKLHRVEDKPWELYEDKIAFNFVDGIIDDLVEIGYLITADDKHLIRSINKTEQRQKKLYIT